MLDPLAFALAAMRAPNAYAAPIAFCAGAVSSLGPCTAPRLLAIAGLSAGKDRRRTWQLGVAFIAGLVLVYASFAAMTNLLRTVADYSAWIYAVVAMSMGVAGCIALWREPDSCRHVKHVDAHAGSAFVLGSSFALVVSPCCTPIVVAIAAYAAAGGSVPYAAVVLACFGLGHALPLVAATFGADALSGLFERRALRHAADVLSGALMLSLAAYYAVLS